MLEFAATLVFDFVLVWLYVAYQVGQLSRA
jgi:hypothetical protein